jgi:Outer membrane protein beta-barrel domain
MKTFYIVAILFFYLSSDAQISIGGKGGISIPNLKGNNEKSKGYTSRIGVYGGLVANFQLTPSLSLHPEINFSPQGGQRKGMQQVPSDAIEGITLPPGMNLYANFKSTTILNYLEIPVLIKLTFGNKLKYYINFGPHVAFLLEAKTKTSGSSSLYLDEEGTIPLMENSTPLPSFDFTNTTDIKESIKKVNAGIQGGLGIEYPLGPGNIFLEGRAIIGMINIQTHPENDGKNKTGSLAAALGYLIKIR